MRDGDAEQAQTTWWAEAAEDAEVEELPPDLHGRPVAVGEAKLGIAFGPADLPTPRQPLQVREVRTPRLGAPSAAE